MNAVWFILLAFPLWAFWSAGRAAAEEAARFSRQLCIRAGVQWLDDSVHQIRLGLTRDGGRLRWRRTYRFEYSHDGQDRYAGSVTLAGERAVSWSEPVARGAPDRLI